MSIANSNLIPQSLLTMPKLREKVSLTPLLIEKNSKPTITLKYSNCDVEIQLPLPEISLSANPDNSLSIYPEYTPNGSLASPYFPDNYSQSFRSSPRSQATYIDINAVNESPISINMIPHGIDEFYASCKSENEKKVFKDNSVFCEICKKSLKQKSFKAHLLTKKHKQNEILNRQ